MTTAAQLAAVVLAGGASRRMGRDKATMPHPLSTVERPLTMVERTVEVLAEVCAPVFVVAAPGQQLPPMRAEILRDELRGIGPLLATGRGLRAAADAGAKRAFVSAVDMPHLSGAVVAALAEHHGADIVLAWDGRDHYLAGIYRTCLADRIDSLIAAGARSMRALAESAITQRVVMAPTRALTNANSLADLSQ